MLRGMARARSGRAPAWPLSSDRSARRGFQGQGSLRVCVNQAISARGRCPAVIGTLDAEGADTYIQRTIPGPAAQQEFAPLPPAWERALSGPSYALNNGAACSQVTVGASGSLGCVPWIVTSLRRRVGRMG